jgi:carboxypeptidase PM20D1
MMFQAAEELIKEGFTPKRDTYFVTACTEEIGGEGGDAISLALKERNIRFHMVLDEGGMILHDPIGGADGTFAMIGVGEKGYVDLKFIAKSNGGHASAPAPHTPVGVLSAACCNMENKPFKAHLTAPVAEMFDTLGRHSNFVYKMIFSNLWCFGGLLDKICKASGGEVNALMRTTVAFTQMNGSNASNVVPTDATMVSNIRLNPMDTMDSAKAYIEKTVNNDKVEVTVLRGMNPSRISRTDCEEYKKVERAVASTWQGALVSPYLMVQCSDSRHYGKISDRVYRFSAMALTSEERKTIHGNNERIKIENISKAVEFYIRLLKQC